MLDVVESCLANGNAIEVEFGDRTANDSSGTRRTTALSALFVAPGGLRLCIWVGGGLDCGYAGWVTDGNNWCSPWKGWQAVYDNSPRQMYREQGGERSKESLILGGEAAMWSEQVDSAAVVHKLFPRVSALGERLWSDPEAGLTWKQAETRMIHHRQVLVSRGIEADALQPEWCHQNEALCYVRNT